MLSTLQVSLNELFKSNKGRFQWLYDNLNRWWKAGGRLVAAARHETARTGRSSTPYETDARTAIRRSTWQARDSDHGESTTATSTSERKSASSSYTTIPTRRRCRSTSALEQLQRLTKREEKVNITWPDEAALLAYSKKLISAARKLRLKTAAKRAKEQTRLRKEEERRAEQERDMERQRKRMEEEAKEEEERRRRKKEKKAAKEKVKESERDDSQRVKEGKSKADKSLGQLLNKRQSGESVTVVLGEDDDIAADEQEVDRNGKQRKSHRNKHGEHKTSQAHTSSSSVASKLATSPKQRGSKSDKQQPTLKSFFSSPSQRMKPLPLIDVNAAIASPSIVSTASPASSSSLSSSRSSRSSHTANRSSTHSKQPAALPPNLFGSRRNENRSAANHEGLGVRRIEWREVDGRDDGDVELSMDDDDEAEQKQLPKSAAPSSKALSSLQSRPTLTGRSTTPAKPKLTDKDDDVIIIDDDEDD